MFAGTISTQSPCSSSVPLLSSSSSNGGRKQEQHHQHQQQQSQLVEQLKLQQNKNDHKFIRRIIILLLLVGIVLLLFVQITKVPLPPRDAEVKSYLLETPLTVGERCLVDGPHFKTPSTINDRHIIVFDAGSTGTRVHVYRFQYCGHQLQGLVGEILFSEVKPGLSHYKDDPKSAGGSLLPLMEDVKKQIRTLCTPISVKATAGLRLLEDDKVNEILNNVKVSIGDNLSGQQLASSHHNHDVSVIDGKEEAVGAWLTVNFLQNKLHLSKTPMLSSVVLDLGGGSTQIVFASDKEQLPSSLTTTIDNYHTVHLFGNKITLYQQSYLGYGMMEARKKIKAFVGSEDPLVCFSDLDSCLRVVKMALFTTEQECAVEPCSFGGVHQPRIHPEQPVIALSYFYDRIQPLLPANVNKVSLKVLIELARNACRNPGSTYSTESAEVQRHSCMDLSYIISLLKDGYSIGMDHQIQVEKQIAGYEMGWSLGAALQMLDSNRNSVEACLKTG